ncbi:MAG: hypothetical protein QW112_02545 [Candidatus Micrarchaeia archaeon]
MSMADEIKTVIEWCEKKKKEIGRIPIIETNPFKHISWLRNKTLLQIDRELNQADKSGIVYDSTTHSLYEFMNGMWRKINR